MSVFTDFLLFSCPFPRIRPIRPGAKVSPYSSGSVAVFRGAITPATTVMYRLAPTALSS